jgi:hypothetical protein
VNTILVSFFLSCKGTYNPMKKFSGNYMHIMHTHHDDHDHGERRKDACV